MLARDAKTITPENIDIIFFYRYSCATIARIENPAQASCRYMNTQTMEISAHA